MPKDRRSFFERLTGSVSADEFYDEEEQIAEEPGSPPAGARPQAHLAMASTKSRSKKVSPKQEEEEWVSSDEDGQLTVDVFQTDNEIIIQSTVAGVRPDDLDVQITRDMVTIRGRREQSRDVRTEDYFFQELYWGTFSRSIVLPQEIDVDDAEATIKNGLLTIRLPKMDKHRTEKLRVKNE